MMLKIKDNVDLKELEKFGFKYESGCYKKEIFVDDCTLQINHDKTICYNNYSTADMAYNCTKLLTELFDLIQAGLVEKVEE